ncbi:helix-turn-helix domain-containing protein [Metabacillus idriensis]|uniref:helix-turn-helix domain-containing protein n=1 Tax=Metabacillus idriensis TaxID=324768 RepID=UPI00174850D5|nr:helix-turn-helix transcriptional regulator [Metabacillus idriensis]
MLIKILLLTEDDYTQFFKGNVPLATNHTLLAEFEMITSEINEFTDHIKGKRIQISNQLYRYVVDYCVISDFPSTHIFVKSCDEIKEDNTISNDASKLELNHAIIERIRELANERNMTVAQTAKLGGIKQSTISEILHGRSQHPKVSTIYQYCQGCNISLKEFFNSPYFQND